MKIAASSLWLERRYGYEKAFRMMKDAGFDAVDYGIDDWVGNDEGFKKSRCYKMSDEELTDHFTKIYECARDTGIEIAQTHAIFGAPASLQFPELFKTVTERSIFATSLLHCKYVVEAFKIISCYSAREMIKNIPSPCSMCSHTRVGQRACMSAICSGRVDIEQIFVSCILYHFVHYGICRRRATDIA